MTDWWWPETDKFWPAGVAREETIDAFAAAIQTKGYLPCDDGNLEEGVEKIGLFALDNRPTHAARQLPDGSWTSKLGRGHDIEHDRLAGVAGALYGSVVMYFKRQRPDQPQP